MRCTRDSAFDATNIDLCWFRILDWLPCCPIGLDCDAHLDCNAGSRIGVAVLSRTDLREAVEADPGGHDRHLAYHPSSCRAHVKLAPGSISALQATDH